MFDDHHQKETSQEGFQQRVLAYAQQMLWPGAPAGEITVEQLPSSGGGQGNRLAFGVTRRWRCPLTFHHPGWNNLYYPYPYPYDPYSYNHYYPDYHTATLWEQEEEEEEGYIIRLPWQTNRQSRGEPDTTPPPLTDLESDIAAHCFVRERTTIPIQPLEFYDVTCWNALGMPHTVQRRVKGERSLASAWAGMDFRQRCEVAREFGEVIGKLLGVKSGNPGVFRLAPLLYDDGFFPGMKMGMGMSVVPLPSGPRFSDIVVGSGGGGSGGSGEFPSRGYATQMLGVIDSLLRARIVASEIETEADGDDGDDNNNADTTPPTDSQIRKRIYASLSEMAFEMTARGVFDNVPYCLVYMDLGPGNILVRRIPSGSNTDLTEEGGKKLITAIQGWEAACFAPAFMACSPPAWMWVPPEWENYAMSVVTDEAALGGLMRMSEREMTAESAEIKRLFETAAGGEEYRRYAYLPVYSLCRVLMRVAFSGICEGGGGSKVGAEECLAAIEEWEGMKG